MSSGELRSSSLRDPNRRQYITPTRPPPINSQEPRPSRGSMITLFQEQQALLQKVIDAQQSMTEKQSAIETKLTLLEKERQEQHQSSGTSKRKRVITLTLSVGCNSILFRFYFAGYSHRGKSIVFMKHYLLIQNINQTKCG